MIPILFKADATVFTSFGIGVLRDCTSCEITEERNGAFECVFKYPTNGQFYEEIKTERLVKAKPNDTANDQMFRIYRITTPLNGIVTVYAQHLSYDLSNVAALLWSSESISPSLAMERLFANTATEHNFTCQTDYSAAKPFSVSKPKSVRACLGGTAGSFLDLWGGEFEWDNFLVKHHQGRGQQTGVVIEYGKNLTSMEHDNDNTEVYTDMLPYAVQTAEDGTETVITLPEVLLPITDSTLVQDKTLIKDFTESFDYGTVITADLLRAKANSYLSANPMGVAMPTLTVAFEPLKKGTLATVSDGSSLTLLNDIPAAHKAALRDIAKGELIIKYGAPIGKAAADIKKGEHVHTHNFESIADDRHEYKYEYDESSVLPGKSARSFLGYKRKSGEVGVRNYIGVISGSFCTNPHLRQFAEAANRRHPKTGNFDGFMPLPHDGGCGSAGSDIIRVLRIVADMIMNPNFGAMLFVELGCEITPFEKVKPYLKDIEEDRLAFIRLQDEPDEYAKAQELLDALYEKVSADRRQPCPVSDLHAALHCGASDAFSGLTANPLLGATAEKLCRQGAKVTLTEITEIIGAEKELMKRAADEQTFGKLVDLINWQHSYLERYGQTADANPSLGNKAGGISTIEEKSMGCVHKAGRCAVTDVCAYT